MTNKYKAQLGGVLLGLAAAGALTGCWDESDAQSAGSALLRCEDLKGVTIAAADIGTSAGLTSGSATVTSAVNSPELAPFADTDGEHQLATASRCVVAGAIAPVDPAAQPINFNINLPLNWNGRALQSGGGGLGGQLITAPGNKGSARFDPIPLNVPYPINQGYATFGSDNGHPPTGYEWAYNDEVMRNYGGEELKKTKDVAVKLIALAYNRAPAKVFFNGESAGARESLIVAQRYADDYDGIIATSPVLNWNYIHISDNNVRDKLIQGFLDQPAITLLANKTRASCDADDGLVDGVIAKYLSCKNDAATLRCADGKPAAGCLSDAQLASVYAIRNPFSTPITVANGINRYQGYGVTGEEDGARYQYPFYPVGTLAPSYPLPAGRGFETSRGGILNFAAFWVRNAIVGKPDFEPYLFDPRPYANRIQYLSNLFDATNPDLSKLVAKKAKLIILQPSADNAVGLPMVADYYRSIVAKMGQDVTDSSVRFYVTAGGGHNASGAAQTDTLALLENWVLNGVAPPDSLVGTDMGPTDLVVRRTAPICRYPMYAKYNGSGDVKLAASFTCTARTDPLAFDPKK